jgi:VWFA-related protein
MIKQIALGLIAAAVALAQTPAPKSPAPKPASPSAADNAPTLDIPQFGVTVQNIVAPVLVTDRDGNIVDGLQGSQFHLYDNGVEQNIRVDTSYMPISLVVAIEKSARVEAILPQLKKLGILLTQITGKSGEAAVLQFDCRIAVPVDFTTDNDKIKVAIENLRPGCNGTRLDDAVERGVYMLSKRPPTNRRVLLLVSETRDEGSEAHLKEVLAQALLQNVEIDVVDISQIAVSLTKKQDQPYPRADIDISNQNLPMGIPSTPTSAAQNFGLSNRAQFVPLLKEIFIDTKHIFVQDHATQFARATGGSEYSFLRQRGLEEAIQKISQNLHSQYLISYAPSNAGEGGFHTIQVTIDREPTFTAHTRPGYYVGGGKQ